MVLDGKDVHGFGAVDEWVLMKLVAPLVDDVVDTRKLADVLLVGAGNRAEDVLADVVGCAGGGDRLVVERCEGVTGHTQRWAGSVKSPAPPLP